MPGHSGIQKEVFALYRRVLRAASKKDRDSNVSPNVSFCSLLGKNKDKGASAVTYSTAYAASEFRRQAASTPRSDFKKIEYMIRKGDKQIKLLNMPGVVKLGGLERS
jgi:hypothetical protein